MGEVLSFIKEHHDTVFDNEKDLHKKLIRVMNSIHLETTGAGNSELDANNNECIYRHCVTQSYINVKCNISKKCRFAMWYKYDKGADQSPINIKYFRTINNNHDIIYHKEAKRY